MIRVDAALHARSRAWTLTENGRLSKLTEDDVLVIVSEVQRQFGRTTASASDGGIDGRRILQINPLVSFR